MTNKTNQNKKKAGYEYLLAYKITVPIYDLTVEFCDKYIPKSSRTHDQMIQASRSGMQNIAEGHKQQSLKGYIYLSGISRGSLEELLKDYVAYARHKQIDLWTSVEAKREIREISEIWGIIKYYPTLPDSPNFPHLPNNQTQAVNQLITLISQANYLIDKLIESLKNKHKIEGGFSEKLLKERLKYRSRK